MSNTPLVNLPFGKLLFYTLVFGTPFGEVRPFAFGWFVKQVSRVMRPRNADKVVHLDAPLGSFLPTALCLTRHKARFFVVAPSLEALIQNPIAALVLLRWRLWPVAQEQGGRASGQLIEFCLEELCDNGVDAPQPARSVHCGSTIARVFGGMAATHRPVSSRRSARLEVGASGDCGL